MKLKHALLLFLYLIILALKITKPKDHLDEQKTYQPIVDKLPINKNSLTIDDETIEITGTIQWQQISKLFNADCSWKEFHVYGQKKELYFQGILWRK